MPCPLYHRISRIKNFSTPYLDSSRNSKLVICSESVMRASRKVFLFLTSSSTSCKKTELGAKVFDHCDRRYKKGFRLLSLLWTDGNTAVPVNSCLLSSTQDKNVLGPETSFDRRSLAGQRRKLSRMKGTKAMIELISKALLAGIKVEYVLFDTWFSSPAQLIDIKKLGLDAIAMIRKSPMMHLLHMWRLCFPDICY